MTKQYRCLGGWNTPRARIQVVVSDVIVADDVGITLRDLGYEVAAAVVASGEEAVERAAQDKLDLVVIDLILRGKNGWHQGR